MTTTHLATVEQVGNALEVDLDPNDETALLWLAVVSEAVRNYTEQAINLVADDVEYQTLADGKIIPRQFPVVSVAKVETMAGDGTWKELATAEWRLLPTTGVIKPSPHSWGAWSWPSGEDEIRITYTHGFAIIPAGLSGVVAAGAANMYNTPAGIVSDRVGQRSATYKASDIFSPLQLVIIDHYKEPITS